MRLIISTGGTSLLTNLCSTSEKKFITEITNLNQAELKPDEFKEVTRLLEHTKSNIMRKEICDIKKASAELNGIFSFYETNNNNYKQDIHILICTDTYVGEEVAKINSSYLSSKSMSVNVWKIPDLKTTNSKLFISGIKSLLKKMFEVIPGYKDSKYEIIFNLVGGFKSIQAYMNTIGMFFADKVIYLFENGDLIEIPKLPIELKSQISPENFSWMMILAIGEIKSNIIPHSFYNIVSEVSYDLVMIDDQEYISLSPWGLMIYNSLLENYIFSEKVTFTYLNYSDKFKKVLKNFNTFELKSLFLTLAKTALLMLNENNPIAALSLDGGILYSNYVGIKISDESLGHFRINDEMRVNCFYWKENLYLLEYGHHNIENNLSKYKDEIERIKSNKEYL